MDYSAKITSKMYFATVTVVDWIDVFTKPVYKDIVVNSLKYCIANKGLIVYGWVIMTNHVHLLIGCGEEHSISDILRDFKAFTSRELYKAISENQQDGRREWLKAKLEYAAKFNSKHKSYVFWQEGNHLEDIFTFEFYHQKLNYIHQNPVKQGFVKNAEDYVYSSAFTPGLLNVVGL